MMETRYQNSPENEDRDRFLQELALAAQQQPPQTDRRRVALNRLWQGILQSNRLGHPQQGRWSATLYPELYNEAVSRTCLEICRKIDRYNPQHPVMAWVNFYLNIHFKKVAEEYYKHSSLPSLDDLDLPIAADETPSDASSLRKFLEEDPEGLLDAERLQKRPDITFQFLALAKYVEDRTWESIANELDISVQTLSSFVDRRLQKLMPYFRKHLL